MPEGAICLEMVLNICPANPSGVQFAINLRTRPCRNQGKLPGAATDVQQPGSRCDSESLEKLLRVLLHKAREEVVVSRHPCCLQTVLELLKVLTGLRAFRDRIHSCSLLAFSCLRPSLRPILCLT